VFLADILGQNSEYICPIMPNQAESYIKNNKAKEVKNGFKKMRVGGNKIFISQNLFLINFINIYFLA